MKILTMKRMRDFSQPMRNVKKRQTAWMIVKLIRFIIMKSQKDGQMIKKQDIFL